ncbi:MAG: phosphatase PAP2 family protein [Spirochaetaceae bacterium]|nr:phosphatase PAP2 family protein [Spirochaetaceae bacterium]
MRKWLLLCLITATSYGHTQSVYTYDLKKDMVLGTVSLGIFISPFFIENVPEHTPDSLHKDVINALDRSLLFSYHKTLDRISDYGVYGMLMLPALSVIGNLDSADTLLTYGIMYTEAFLLTFGTKDLLKNGIIRYRPYMYEDSVPVGILMGKEDDYYNSFPSGSTSLAFLSATFLSTTFSREYSESLWKLPVILGSYTLATSVAAMRIASGSHFITDVLAGAAIGSLYGWIIPFLHRRQNSNLVLQVTGTGFLVSLTL